MHLARTLGALALALSVPAHAVTLTFHTSDSQFDAGVDNQGWWSDVADNDDANDNYVVGWVSEFGTSADYRNFFTFDLSSLTGTVSSARLEVVRYSYSSPDAAERYTLFDVSTDAATLNDNTGTNAAIFADLGSGTSYGSHLIASYPPSNAGLLGFDLNAAGVADINAAAGGFFSIGGALQDLTRPPNVNELITGASGGAGIQRLILEVDAAAPEPATLALLGLGLAALGARGRRAR